MSVNYLHIDRPAQPGGCFSFRCEKSAKASRHEGGDLVALALPSIETAPFPVVSLNTGARRCCNWVPPLYHASPHKLGLLLRWSVTILWLFYAIPIV